MGTNIKSMRKRLGLTQEELAERLGVHLTTINRWEKGHVQPSPLAVNKLIQMLENYLNQVGSANKTRTDRWVFSESELAKLESSDKTFVPRVDDELIAHTYGLEQGVIVYRNGTVSNRWRDGTVGITNIVQSMISTENSYVNDRGENYDQWRDVLLNEDFEFVKLL